MQYRTANMIRYIIIVAVITSILWYLAHTVLDSFEITNELADKNIVLVLISLFFSLFLAIPINNSIKKP